MARTRTPSPPAADWLESSKRYVRRDPAKAVAGALGVGLLLKMLPLAALTVVAVRIFFALSRPVLLFLGFLKAIEICHSNSLLSRPD